MPTERAHGVQVIKTCEALAQEGSEVTLVVPRRTTPIQKSPKEYYGLTKEFPIIYVPVVDTVSWGFLGFLLETLSFVKGAMRVVRTQHTDVIYGRDELPLAFILFLGAKNVVWESHTGAWNSAARFVAKRARAIITISQGLKDLYVSKGIPETHITVAHDGVDVAAFVTTENKTEARNRLGLPQDETIALYIGSLGQLKGTDTLMQTSKFVSNVRIAIIGGSPRQIETAKKKYPKVIFVGERPYAELAQNQVAADVLVLPNTGKNSIAERFTSPLKLFAYMTSSVPIVTSNISSVREVLDDTCAYLVTPDDAHALASGIERACTDSAAQGKAAGALQRVHQYDWRVRARKILQSVGK